jgi:hypothetical protein
MTLNRLCFPRFAPAFIASVFIASVFIASGVVLGDEQLSLAAQQSIDLRDEDDRPARVAILFDRSMSMGLPADDGRPRRTHADLALAKLLAGLPIRTEFVFLAFNGQAIPMHERFLSLSSSRRRQVMQFAESLTPQGDTNCAESVGEALRRWPRLDAVFLITDGRAPNPMDGERQAETLGKIQQKFGFQFNWIIVDLPTTPNLRRMLQLSRGRRW